MSPTGIGQLHITVSDLDASLRWYRDVLGLPHLFTVEGRPMAFLQAGSVRLYLGATEGERYRSRPVVYYDVDDVESAYAEVTGRGAESLSGPHVVHRDGDTELWMAFVADPDGNPVGLMAERPATG
jgi:catechol 2,3-dioxygenase-like lactoylglutathione lyase family enzyme